MTRDSPIPIRYYREKRLETEINCESCALRYAVYGVFAFCPDCGMHNSGQILRTNLDLAVKQLDLAEKPDATELREQLIVDTLENVVSSFDGFGRALCHTYASKATAPHAAEGVSFQDLDRARTKIRTLFGLDMGAFVEDSEWRMAVRSFHRRHLIAHKMGVIDNRYVRDSGDSAAILGRLVKVEATEVRNLVLVIGRLGQQLQREIVSKIP